MGSSYRDLIVWQKAKQLALLIYIETKVFPRDEIYGLTAQLRRALISVASNIAEGQGRLTKGEFLQALGFARGSLQEVKTQAEIALDLGYLSADSYKKIDQLSEHVRALLNRLIDSLRSKAKAAGA